jgi:hypothetical protein
LLLLLLLMVMVTFAVISCLNSSIRRQLIA